MKEFKPEILIFIGILIFPAIGLLLTVGQTAIDIQLHDTYYILDKLSLAIIMIGPLTFLIFLARAIPRKFKTKATNIALSAGLILVALMTYQAIRLEESYLTEMTKLDVNELPDKGQFITEAKNKIHWTWGLLGLFSIGLVLLTIRTVMFWNDSYSTSK